MTPSPAVKSARAIWPAILVALTSAILVWLLLSPASGVDRQPPDCYAYFGYLVPCGSMLWIGGAILAGLVSGALTFLLTRGAPQPRRD